MIPRSGYVVTQLMQLFPVEPFPATGEASDVRKHPESIP